MLIMVLFFFQIRQRHHNEVALVLYLSTFNAFSNPNDLMAQNMTPERHQWRRLVLVSFFLTLNFGVCIADFEQWNAGWIFLYSALYPKDLV